MLVQLLSWVVIVARMFVFMVELIKVIVFMLDLVEANVFMVDRVLLLASVVVLMVEFKLVC